MPDELMQSGRWRWWYSSIAEWMLANPGRALKYAARCEGGPIDAAVVTIRMIAATDLFRAHLNKRKAEFREHHDYAITRRSMELHDLTSELLIESLNAKRDKVPIETLMTLRTDALEALGYGGKQPVVQVNNVDQRVQVAVTPALLEEARAAIRHAEQRAPQLTIDAPTSRRREPDSTSELDVRVDDPELIHMEG